MSGNLGWIPPTWIYAIASVLLTSLTGLGWIVIKRVVATLKKDWDEALEKLTTIENITCVQAENHLYTIQTESVKQTNLLTEMNEKQAENNGKLGVLIDILSKKV